MKIPLGLSRSLGYVKGINWATGKHVINKNGTNKNTLLSRSRKCLSALITPPPPPKFDSHQMLITYAETHEYYKSQRYALFMERTEGRTRIKNTRISPHCVSITVSLCFHASRKAQLIKKKKKKDDKAKGAGDSSYRFRASGAENALLGASRSRMVAVVVHFLLKTLNIAL